MCNVPSKVCFRCGELKPLTDFYAHPKMADGRVNKCKACNCGDVRLNRREKVDYYRAYDIKRKGRPRAAYQKAWEDKYPKRVHASAAVNHAVRDKRLVKIHNCEWCNAQPTVGHHCDYDKVLEVIWLCPPCHSQWHSENGAGINGEGPLPEVIPIRPEGWSSKALCPLIHRCVSFVDRRVNNGSIIKPDKCSKCDCTCVPTAHHDDYLMPANFSWLCTSCHTDWHKENGFGLNHDSTADIKTNKYPKKYAAVNEVCLAVNNGTLIKQDTCSDCGRDNARIYHDDYDKPLEVRWLCYNCCKKRGVLLA